MADNLSQSSVGMAGSRVRNAIVALVAIALAIALFLGLQAPNDSASLDAQADRSVPLEVALSNSKPTLMEFYANWCTSCQAMAKDLEELKQEYGDSANFVMLNVDNNKWLPEILRYRVDGIPHFVYLNRLGEAIAQTIGEQPRSILQDDLAALVANRPLPHANATGKVSEFTTNLQPTAASQDDPRSHSAQANRE